MQGLMDKKSEISERITELIEFLGLNASSFSKKLGYKRAQSIYDILNGKSLPSFDFFYRLLNTEFSVQVNLEYIITGNGELIDHTPISSARHDNSNELKMIKELAAENAILKRELEEYRQGKRVQHRSHGNYAAEP